jgi:hypothetical protein
MHWGTLWPLGLGQVMRNRLQQPPVDIARHAPELAPEVKVLLTPPGETVAASLGEPRAVLWSAYR